MSRLCDLLADTCPDGVTFVRLSDTAELKRGNSITKKQIIDGDIPVVAGGRTAAYYHGESNRDGETIVVAGSGAYAGFVSWWEGPIFVSDAFSIKPNSEILLSKYCFYWLLSKQEEIHNLKRGGGVPHVYAKDMAKFLIPVPPLEIQSEIVRILDTFSKMEAELEAELEARKQQYEHYQSQFLTFNESDVNWLTLGDIGRVAMCKRVFKDETASSGDIPFFKIGTFGGRPDAFISRDLYEEYRDRFSFPNRGDILLSAAGTIGRAIPYNGEHAYFQDSNIVWLAHDESIVLNSFLRYWYRVVKWSTDGGTIKRLYNANIRKAKIAVPSIEEQRRIVGILDKFDALVNDLSIGLPAELAARRQQYEYYRDKLLTFKELEPAS